MLNRSGTMRILCESRWIVGIALTLMPAAVQAQDTFQRWPGLNVPNLDVVYVTDDAGRQIRGRLVGFESQALVLLVDGAERRIEAASVRRIDKRGDSIRNGALIGTAVGVLFGVIGAGLSDCPGEHPGGGCAGFRAAAFFGTTVIYASVGTGIDALVTGRTRLYDAAHPGAATAAHPDDRRLAVNLRVAW